MNEINDFFKFANERQRIFLRKEKGLPREQWTTDPVLKEFSFCNIFREDDRTTKFFRDTVREPLRNSPDVLVATIAWRWFNRIETCRLVSLDDWAWGDTSAMRSLLADVRPLVTGAYVIKTPNGMNKLEGILSCIERVKLEAPRLIEQLEQGMTLQELHADLMLIPYLGPFMAYEIVTDLRHTYLLENAPDIDSWASAGPGCCRGAGWVNSGNPDEFSYGSRKSQTTVLKMMNTILWESVKHWDWPDRPWEMREVEHTLCEYDKYRRAQGGQRLKRRYQP